jgi:microcystin-dependent protein
MFAGNFAPVGWHFCDGALMPISENETLFTLIGTTYGGDGESTFALPDLQSRVPIHWGNGVILAETGGAEEITLTVNQIPAHSHPLLASTNNATAVTASGNLLAQTPTYTPYIAGFTPATNLSPNSVGPTGGSQPHTNLQPFLTLNFIISLFGIFPSQS